MGKEKVRLTKSFMEEHGKRKDSLKIDWNQYVRKLKRGQIKGIKD